LTEGQALREPKEGMTRLKVQSETTRITEICVSIGRKRQIRSEAISDRAGPRRTKTTRLDVRRIIPRRETNTWRGTGSDWVRKRREKLARGGFLKSSVRSRAMGCIAKLLLDDP